MSHQLSPPPPTLLCRLNQSLHHRASFIGEALKPLLPPINGVVVPLGRGPLALGGSRQVRSSLRKDCGDGVAHVWLRGCAGAA
jgi:hypothetical protein